MKRSHLKYSKDAVLFLGRQIQLGRKMRKMSELDFADRAGIARSTLQRIEKGDPSVEIGIVFNVAHIAGIRLFEVENNFSAALSQAQDKLALLPKRIRKSLTNEKVKDDF